MIGFLRGVEARVTARRGAWLVLVAATACAAAYLAGGPAASALAPLPYGALAAGLLASHGSVAGPLRSGELLLWLSRPVRPGGLVLRWLAEVQAVAAGGAVATALCAGLAASAVGGGSPGDVAALLPALLGWSATAAALGFAVSASGVHPDGVLAVLWIFAVSPFLLLAAEGAPAGAAAELLAYPFEHLGRLQEALLAGRGALDPAGRLGIHLALWSLVGVVVGAARCRSPTASAAGR